MGRFTRVLAALLGRWAGLLPAARRDWAEAVLAEVGEVPAGAARMAWLRGGLWLVAREVLMARVMRVLAFVAGAVGLAWIGWPGAPSNSATPLNRVYVTVTLTLLAVLPLVVRRHFGPVRGGWAPRAARVGGYAMVLALIAAKTAKDRGHLGCASALGGSRTSQRGPDAGVSIRVPPRCLASGLQIPAAVPLSPSRESLCGEGPGEVDAEPVAALVVQKPLSVHLVDGDTRCDA
jgi:hypothetical protein